MWRYAVGLLAGVLLMGGGVLWLNMGSAARHIAPSLLASRPATAGAASDAADPVPEPPVASAKTREEKRFSRYDHDKNGAVSRDEFLAARHKAFAKLDTNHDGALSFDEYAVKTTTRFAAADADRNGTLTPPEFATTRIVRKTRPRAACPPATARHDDAEDG